MRSGRSVGVIRWFNRWQYKGSAGVSQAQTTSCSVIFKIEPQDTGMLIQMQGMNGRPKLRFNCTKKQQKTGKNRHLKGLLWLGLWITLWINLLK